MIAAANAVSALPVGIVADDLTGALDAAAQFARSGAPVRVLRDADRAAALTGSWALDAATRNAEAATARHAAVQAGKLLSGAKTAFRKIDSLLRGHVADEIAATARAGGFASVVIAPAFPAQGRVARKGRQYARAPDGSWRAIDVDLAAELAERALPPRIASEAKALRGGGAFLCDAESDADLAAIAGARIHLSADVLWCGSAGLARALAGTAARRAAPPGPYLGIVATREQATLSEIERVRRHAPEAVLEIRKPDAIVGIAKRASARLSSGKSFLALLRLQPMSNPESAAALHTLTNEIARLRPPALFASGGDTLAAVIDAIEAEWLDVEGEIAPGIPVSRIAGGVWNGIPVVSKSGAFSAEGVLMQLFNDRADVRHGQT